MNGTLNTLESILGTEREITKSRICGLVLQSEFLYEVEMDVGYHKRYLVLKIWSDPTLTMMLAHIFVDTVPIFSK